MPIDYSYSKTTTPIIQPTNRAPTIRRIDRDNPHSGAPEPTVLIIGAGTFGTSTAYHLAHQYKDASKVTIIDQAPSPPLPAASIDVNRVIRTDYANRLYCDLACETIHPWFWSEELGPYFHKVGWLMFEERGSSLWERIRQTFVTRGSTQAEGLRLEGLEGRWPCLKGTDVNDFQGAYFNPEAGWCDAKEATGSFMRAAERKGVKRITGTVKELIYERGKTGRIVGARTEDGREILAEKVLLAAGAWSSKILSSTEEDMGMKRDERLESQIQATGLVAAYYRLQEDEITVLDESRMPVVVYGGQGEIIPPSRKNQLMKYANSTAGIINSIALPSGAKVSVPADQYYIPECLKKETVKMMSERVLPQCAEGKEPEYWRICWDAQTPTEDFLICGHPKLKGLWLATGGSFHSYKFLPIIGKYIMNTLAGLSNGFEMDAAWEWKAQTSQTTPTSGVEDRKHWTDIHERGLLSTKAVTKTELKDLFAKDGGSSTMGPRL